MLVAISAVAFPFSVGFASGVKALAVTVIAGFIEEMRFEQKADKILVWFFYVVEFVLILVSALINLRN